MARKFANFFATKLKNDIDATTTSITLESVPRDKDNNIITSGRIVLEARNSDKREIIKYTDITAGTTTLTGCTRGDGRTTATTHTKGAVAEANVTGEDLSELYASFESFSASNNDWFSIPAAPNAITSLGQKIYQLVFPATDLRGIVQAGTRLKGTRTVVPATVRGKLRYASLRVASKIGGLTGFSAITDTVTVQVKINFSGYRDQCVISARNGSNGFDFYFFSNGSMRIHGNLSPGNYKLFQTRMAYPINKDTVITAKMQMSTGLCKIFFDGVEVPTLASHAGTANSMSPTDRIYIGSDGTAGYVDADIQEVAIYNAYLADNVILDRLDKTLAGNEAGLVAYYKFNETSGTTVNDATTNANHLTASNSDILNNTGNFFNAVEMGLVTDMQYSGGNSTVTVFGGSKFSFPTSGGMTNFFYSNRKSPAGFPVDDIESWCIDAYWYGVNSPSTVANNSGAWQSIEGFQTQVPKGGWDMSWRGIMTESCSAGATPRIAVEFSDVSPGDATRPYHRQNQTNGEWAQGSGVGTSGYGVYQLQGNEKFTQKASALYKFWAVGSNLVGTGAAYFERGSVRVRIASTLL